MTKEMHEINSNAIDFVAELIDYIFTYSDDDYMTMECLCRKLHKYGLIDKQDGKYTADTPQTGVPRCSISGTPFDECGFCEHFNCDTCHCEADTPQTDCDKCIWNVCNYNKVEWDADTPQADEIGDCNICRFAGCSECDDCINGSEWVRETEIDDLD